jgi:serine/threonine-protein kinase RsbW
VSIQTQLGKTLIETGRASGGVWTKTCLSTSAEVGPLLDRIEAVMLDVGYAPRTCRELRLVLEEAIVNGLKHGNGGDSRKQVRICYHVGCESVLADVEDEGPGFNPSLIPDPTLPENWERPCGRGLLLMRHFTTWMSFSARGNRVTLCKSRSA